MGRNCILRHTRQTLTSFALFCVEMEISLPCWHFSAAISSRYRFHGYSAKHSGKKKHEKVEFNHRCRGLRQRLKMNGETKLIWSCRVCSIFCIISLAFRLLSWRASLPSLFLLNLFFIWILSQLSSIIWKPRLAVQLLFSNTFYIIAW